MDLPTIEPLGTAAESSFLQRFQLDVMSLVQISVLALVALVLGLFVVRPILANTSELAMPALPSPVSENRSGQAPDTVHTGEIDDGQGGRFNPAPELSVAGQAGSGMELAKLSNGSEETVDRLRSLIGERQEETFEILRTWLEESEEKI